VQNPGIELLTYEKSLFNRDFKASAPNEKWLNDITEFQIAAG